jgi:two-component system phosphate regulon sensor histidine kinase PhoR
VVLAGLLSLGFSIAITQPLRQIVGRARAMACRRPLAPARGWAGATSWRAGRRADLLAGELQRRLRQLEGERAEMQALIDSMAEG